VEVAAEARTAMLRAKNAVNFIFVGGGGGFGMCEWVW
jgi:hypothetical protein